MNTAIRAHRILLALENYGLANEEAALPFIFNEAQLGDLIGCYRNPGEPATVVGIFFEGLAWESDGKLLSTRFSDIAEASLILGKESEGILLKIRDGRHLNLPIKGKRGKFYDSMEVLRFVDRVMQDLKRGGGS